MNDDILMAPYHSVYSVDLVFQRHIVYNFNHNFNETFFDIYSKLKFLFRMIIYVLYRVKLSESFRMISKSSKSTDGMSFKHDSIPVYPLVKMNTQVHFLGKLML